MLVPVAVEDPEMGRPHEPFDLSFGHAGPDFPELDGLRGAHLVNVRQPHRFVRQAATGEAQGEAAEGGVADHSPKVKVKY